MEPHKSKSPGGATAENRLSAQKIFLVERDAVFPGQFPQFVRERDSSVMLLLSLDITTDFGHPGLTHGDAKVSNLPFEAPLDLSVLVDPARGIRFDEAKRRGNSKVRLELHQQVDMLRHATDLQEDAPLATHDSTDVFIEGLSEAVLDQGDASLRGEDDVVEEVCEAGGHSLLSPLRGFAEILGLSLGLTRPGFMLSPLRGFLDRSVFYSLESMPGRQGGDKHPLRWAHLPPAPRKTRPWQGNRGWDGHGAQGSRPGLGVCRPPGW